MTRANILNLITSKILTGGSRTTAAFVRDVVNELTNSLFVKDTDTADNITDGSTKVLMTSTERTKLTGIDTGAEVNPTAAEIKTEYESNSDTNAFTDDEKNKLGALITPIREFFALVNFSASPTITIVTRTFLVDPSIANTGTGVFEINAASMFSVGRTDVQLIGNNSGFFRVDVSTNSKIDIIVTDKSDAPTDGLQTAALLKVSVY